MRPNDDSQSGMIVLLIPGDWDSEEQFQDRARPHWDRFGFAGGIVANMVSGFKSHYKLLEAEPGIAEKFRIGGRGQIDDGELWRIGQHRSILMLEVPEVGITAAREALLLGAAILDIGGIAVKVESSGLAFSAEGWKYYAKMRHEAAALLYPFVSIVQYEGYLETCGMHCMGLPEIQSSLNVEGMLFIEKVGIAMIGQGDKFDPFNDLMLKAAGIVHHIAEIKQSPFSPTDIFHNPRGVLVFQKKSSPFETSIASSASENQSKKKWNLLARLLKWIGDPSRPTV